MTLPANSIVINFGDEPADHVIIWLHGLGATANDFPPIVPELGIDPGLSIKFIFPQAPSRPITINGGMVMPGWYDIKGMSLEQKQDRHGIQASSSMVQTLIDQHVQSRIEGKKIILAGFSQGGAVAYYTAVRSHTELGGVLALSTYLPFAQETADEHSGINLSMPILAHHGTHDPVVPLQFGRQSVESLRALAYEVDWKTYPMEHQVVMEQIKDIGSWINRVWINGA